LRAVVVILFIYYKIVLEVQKLKHKHPGEQKIHLTHTWHKGQI